MEDALSNHFECFHCHTTFRRKVYEIVRERCRLHFLERVPYFEIEDSRGLECYCSRGCLDSRMDEVMGDEHVPLTLPGLSQVASCAHCQSPVDRTSFHYAYLATLSEPLDDVIWDTVEMDCLAIVCETCSARLLGNV